MGRLMPTESQKIRSPTPQDGEISPGSQRAASRHTSMLPLNEAIVFELNLRVKKLAWEAAQRPPDGA
jgi:hypothetical protein